MIIQSQSNAICVPIQTPGTHLVAWQVSSNYFLLDTRHCALFFFLSGCPADTSFCFVSWGTCPCAATQNGWAVLFIHLFMISLKHMFQNKWRIIIPLLLNAISHRSKSDQVKVRSRVVPLVCGGGRYWKIDPIPSKYKASIRDTGINTFMYLLRGAQYTDRISNMGRPHVCTSYNPLCYKLFAHCLHIRTGREAALTQTPRVNSNHLSMSRARERRYLHTVCIKVRRQKLPQKYPSHHASIDLILIPTRYRHRRYVDR